MLILASPPSTAVSASADMAVGHQPTLDHARALGESGMRISMDAASKRDPLFAETASKAILAHLSVVGQASGEDLVDVAIAHGAKPADARAFGGVFQALARKKLIACVRSDLPRRRGHGTSGGRLWGWVDPCYFSSDEAHN